MLVLGFYQGKMQRERRKVQHVQ